jgi:predicted nucleic acid-binding protein
MDVFIIPIGGDGYELYCETSTSPLEPAPSTDSVLGRLRFRFTVMLRAAEERRQGGHHEPALTWWGRAQERIFAWVAERIAEQRLLWNLRRETAVVIAHPKDMTSEQVLALVRRILQRDLERHRRWLVVDALLLIISGALALVPGPNLVAYYFAFRVVGHWLSMRGARQGLQAVVWTGRACAPLDELRDVVALSGDAREARVHEIAARLRLQHLSTFFERVAVRHA